MTSPVRTIAQNHSVREAAAFLLDVGIHGAPVVSRKGRVVGVISMTDVTRYERERPPEFLQGEAPAMGPFQMEGWEGPTVKEVMTPTVISVPPASTLSSIVKVFVRRHVHRVMVMNRRGALLGVISETDVLKACFGVKSPGRKRLKRDPVKKLLK